MMTLLGLTTKDVRRGKLLRNEYMKALSKVAASVHLLGLSTGVYSGPHGGYTHSPLAFNISWLSMML